LPAVLSEVICGFRAVIFYIFYAFGVVIVGMVGLLVAPLLPIRQRYYVISRFNCYALWLAKVICGIRCEIIGRDKIPSSPCVVVCNHESAWEAYMTGLLFQPQATVLKLELMNIPFYGWALRPLKPIALDRSKPKTALKQLLKQGGERLLEGYWIVVFPEGTRVRPGQKGKFNKGAAMLAVKEGVPVLPVAHNAGKCWPAGQLGKYPGLITMVIGDQVTTVGKSTQEVHDQLETWIRATADDLPCARL
jgi:1-acyl-sn-glycerol-3-phosphate acyltransferase